MSSPTLRPTAPAEPVDPADWRAWPFERKRKLLGQLRDLVGEGWRALARKDQLPPEGEWQKLFLRGGRGSGKSWAGAHTFAELIQNDPFYESDGPGRWAIVAPTFGDARDKCVESAESGLLMALGTSVAEVEAGISPTVAKWNRSIGECQLRDGTMVHIDGADDGAYRIQGWNMRGCWADEVGLWKKWKASWEESIGFAVRAGEAKIVATGTPKRNQPARQLVKQLLADPEVVSRRLLTKDNLHNLSAAFKAQVLRYEGTELGRQELGGELLDEVEGALWKRAWIDKWRTDDEPQAGYRASAVALDPSDGSEDGAEQALCVAGLGLDNDFYVLTSEGHRTTSFKWLKRALELARTHRATIVIEKNHGGQALVELLEQVMEKTGIRAPYVVVWASTGKATRAEPVAALYEAGRKRSGRVRHLGEFPELEEQMTNWTGDGSSPDRMDALVWAITHLMGYGAPAGQESGVHRYSDESAGVHRWA